ncbi:uncharacterized protein LOC133038408 [Cannabis sativa]|uniref:uncharacterized protein LOC133038408 n=1 Tax=Cannabis sativa TaxID=3483 RepID=UPI0029CA4C24|nr:uncharacterized protein LOC133038408 [Cannabis sativa]
MEDCGVIVDKIKKKLHTWATRHLSYAGRLQLIHTVLLGLRNYWMNIFVLPQSVIKEIEKHCRLFLWGQSGNRCKVHFGSWEKVCRPKHLGGLGFMEGTKWNMATLAKFLWAIMEKHDVLWVKWVNVVYMKGDDIWNYKLGVDTSWYWKKLCHLRKDFKQQQIMAAGRNGKFMASFLYNNMVSCEEDQYCKAVWNRYNIPKHRFILWQTVHTQLLTRDQLAIFHISILSSDCPVCGLEAETHQHLFFDCCFSKQVVYEIFSWLGFQAWNLQFTSWRTFLSITDSRFKDKVVVMLLAAVVYYIWLNRNKCTHDNSSYTIGHIVKEIKRIVKYRLYSYRQRRIDSNSQGLMCMLLT